MAYTSLAVLALAASSALPNFSTMLHLHPHTQPDARVNITLVNTSVGFRDVKIEGVSYEVGGHQALLVKAPAGTTVFADSRTPKFRRGDAELQLTPEMNDTRVNLN